MTIENIKEAVIRINNLAIKEKTKFTRDFYTENREPNDPSKHAIVGEFGSWADAMAFVFGEEAVDSDGYEDNPDHFDPEYELVKKVTRRGLYKVFVIPDIHVPFHSNKAVNCMLELLEAYKPDEVIQLGDLCDFYKISSYTKSPGRGESFQSELDKAITLLKRIKKASGGARATLLEGNHEYRLHKYIANQASSLGGVRALTLESLLELKDIGWNLINQHQFYQINNVHFTHGEFVTPHSSEKHMNVYNESIIHGHTHRIAVSMRKFLNRTLEGWEIGCLASLKVSQEYQKSANWQHGCATVDIHNDNYWVTPYHIRDGKASFRGRILEGSNEDPTTN
jgi:UDP-2,3-diacylglucosamine pyrophosphatase LpxH